jgi:hypothetical protein
LYYDDASDAKQDWHAIKDQSRIAELNSKLRGANLYTLPSKAGFYYRQRPDGSYAKFQGDPAKHSASSKQVQIITPSDKNYKYLDQNKEYSFTFTGKKQMGGFTDMDSGLNKFVYGGDENFAIPETGGKLTDSPYFEEGGYLPQAQDGKEQKKIVKAYKNGKFVGYTTQDIADSKGLDWNSADNYYDSEETETETETDIDTDTGYNSYSPYAFPGGYAKQKGLPYDPSTGEMYKGSFPGAELSSIDVHKTRMSGAPKKFTVNYNVEHKPFEDAPDNRKLYRGSDGQLHYIGTPEASQNKSEDWTRKQDRQAVRDQLGTGYKLPQLFQNSMSSKENDKSPRLRNWFDQQRSEKLNIPFLEPKAYGGDMDYAQIGENYPYDNDQRFSSDMSNFNVPPGYFKDINTGGYKNFAGESWNPKYSEKFQLDANVTPDNSFTLDETYKNPITGESPGVRMGTDGKYVNEGIYGKNGNRETVSVDYKGKATNADNLSNLNKFNTGVSAALSIYGGRGERERLKKMYENYTSDSIYGNTSGLDRGTYEANSGLFKPDEMGFKGVVKNGGYMQDGGDFSPYETYMSEDQIQKFLEEGGELEFV